MADHDNGLVSPDYPILLSDLKARIHAARMRATLAANEALVLLYWDIGRAILARQADEGWGTKVIERLSADLRGAFPDMKGLSSRNLKYMRRFSEAWPEREIVQRLVAQIPWGHNVRLIDKLSSAEERLWYARKTIEHAWSRNVLVMQIESGLIHRQGAAVTNFDQRLLAHQSDLANNLLKDPYIFGFLGLEVGGDEFFVDMLFYHLHLRCYVVVELKVVPFRPEFAGKLNFYLAAVDDLMRHPDDAPTIGLLLCRGKNEVVVEYALRDMTKPMGVSDYQLTEALPDTLRGKLPTVAELEAELESQDVEASRAG